MHTKTTTTPLFAAELTPHRGLTRGDGWMLGGLSLVLFIAPWLLLLADALPVVAGVMALAGLGIIVTLARRGNSRRREHITVWADQVELLSTDERGLRTLKRFQPSGVRLLLTRDADEKTTAVQLRHGKDVVEVGAFLSLEDRSSFGRALGTALRRARTQSR
ncbi:DUF2244 domain-containing protein [Devosia aquimaris]|uniref:DUF2244 domain-containing protein n=1 Tax=Devosia aquimaris TaxID=2866214 RepID=UPI001CD13A2B|nr:DUF2244 domain-containing protein [Devosia sp. CJK-A8-3]